MPKAPDKFKPKWIGEQKPREKQSGRKERSKNYDTVRWRKIRKAHLSRNPLCVECQKNGRITEARVLDHIISHRSDDSIDFFDTSNHQGLCDSCHNRKSGTESRNK